MKCFALKNKKLFNFGKIKHHSTWIEPKGSPTGIHFKNSLTNTKTELKIKEENSMLSWYSCGPTVYDDSHLGHARNYICIDLIQRIIKNHFNVPLYHLMGVTDVDDKIIKKAKEENRDALELARMYEKKFFDDLIALNVQLPQTILRVSEHIEEIILFIQQIQKNGYAYESNGSIYFDSLNFKRDGGIQKLFSNNFEENQESQISQTSEKKNAQDFALWKNEDTNNLGWQSPFGYGRPGWHIECSAMIQ